MKFRYDEFFKTVDYMDSSLPRHLKLDSWHLLDGFLLLVGLCPDKTVICPGPYGVNGLDISKDFSSFKNLNYNELPQLHFNNFQPLNVNEKFSVCLDELGQKYSIGNLKNVLLSMIPSDLNKAMPKKGRKLTNDLPEIDLPKKQVKDALNKIIDAKESYELNFNHLIWIWFSGTHWKRKEDLYPRKDFINWAQEKWVQEIKIDVPWFDWAKNEGLISMGPFDYTFDGKPPYLNKGHGFYSTELKIAVEAWIELYENNPPPGPPNGQHIEYICAWLEQNYPKISVRAKARISTMINPDIKDDPSQKK